MSAESQVPPEDLVAKSGFFKGMNPLMAILSMVMILGFVGFTIQDVEYSGEVFTKGKDFIINTLDWFYVFVERDLVLRLLAAVQPVWRRKAGQGRR